MIKKRGEKQEKRERKKRSLRTRVHVQTLIGLGESHRIPVPLQL